MAKQTRINNIGSINGLTAQMRAVYRLARKNVTDEDLDPQTAKILVDILKIIVAAQRDSEIEERLAKLEALNDS